MAVVTYLGLMLAYGAVNCLQDAWNEQIMKRGWTGWSIPSPVLPSAKPIWIVIVAAAIVATLLLLWETRSASYSADR